MSTSVRDLSLLARVNENVVTLLEKRRLLYETEVLGHKLGRVCDYNWELYKLCLFRESLSTHRCSSPIPSTKSFD